MEMVKNLALAVEETQTPPANWMVVVMGVGVVFVGLVFIILICKIMGLFFTGEAKKAEAPAAAAPAPAAKPAEKSETIPNRGEIIAAVTAACAEEMGKDVSAIRVISFKKI